MKKRLFALLSCVVLAASSIAGCSSSKPAETQAAAPAETTAAAGAETTKAPEAAPASGDTKIALITMDSIDQHWVTLNEGAQKAAGELGVTVTFMSPNTKDDAQQI